MENLTNKEMEIFNVGAETKSEMIVAEDGSKMLMELTGNRQIAYCSLKANTIEEKKKLYNAQNSPDGKLADMINMEIDVKDVYVEIVKLTDQNTGEEINAPRIVLIDKDGKSYQCVSVGIFKCLAKIFNLFGTPDTWKTHLTLKVKQVKTNKGSALTLEF